ncbi:hypothetical protein GCK72_012795 [Caenorhabditis remanei]|uniref:Uncharacterized protein n=1 Tax=Caenorhabditis remanei TaxID=31234 RepID=A0A6A5GPI9_CAERE|nr:hypothetical protein GCK72_012795 [Caenorhabditis remanei]KAF1756342.1 hypothetical protein GCK72_012795 [Caenorhabditis remanei]
MAITFESIIEFAFILAVLSACAVLFRRLGERAAINKPPPPPNRRHRHQKDSREDDESEPASRTKSETEHSTASSSCPLASYACWS